MRYVTTIENHEVLIDILDERRVSVDGVLYEFDFEQVGDQPVFSLIVNGQSHDAMVYQEDDRWQVLLQGKLYSAIVEDEREKRLRAALGGGPAESDEFSRRPCRGWWCRCRSRRVNPLKRGMCC